MSRVLALALLVATMAAVRELGVRGTADSAATALAVGFALMGASVAGDVLRRFQLPRLTGLSAVRHPGRPVARAT